MTNQQMTNKQMDALLSAVEAAGSILLFSHVSPDGDTLGSALALKLMLERLRMPVSIVLDGEVPENLCFLPDVYCVRQAAELQPEKDRLGIAVDVSSPDRLGAALTLFEACATRVVVDHHETNPAFGQINLIDGEAPATAVMVHRIFKAMDMPIGREEAICLYTALATDTGNFVYDSTNAEAFAIMSELMQAGLPLATISQTLFRRKTKPFVELLGETLPSLQVSCNGALAGLRLTQAQMQRVGAGSSYTDGIVDYAIDIASVKLAYFARENEDGSIKFSMRAHQPFRVDQVAERFGGGGHVLAAGCTLHEPMEEAVRIVEEALSAAYHGSEDT